MRSSGPWVAEKLDYLQRYLSAFTIGMRKRWPVMHYIDLFSGPGKCQDKGTGTVHLGSPLIALAASHPFTRYFFVDLDSKNIDALERRCCASTVAERVILRAEDANTAVNHIVEYIRASERENGRSLNLAFLDPTGLQLQWQTVAMLSRVPRMDMIIYYPDLGLRWNMKQLVHKPNDTAVDLFFGGRAWRQIYLHWQSSHSGTGIHRLLIDHYKSNLAKLGYKYQGHGNTGDEPLIRNTRRGPLYRLMFFSKHPLGLEIWNSITSRDVYGQKRMPLS
ncbi:MAG: hypothetical protein A2Y73_03535 [Chloroflexi bacterium RBG_13_56_8]|nr:MAG: hypothetical protein A2Y73_03535 [Chloroflexi bacterium RBG_13_56_8]